MSRNVARATAPDARARWGGFGRRRAIYLLTLAAPILAGGIALLVGRFVPRPPGGFVGARGWMVPLVLGLGLAWAAIAVAAWWRVTRWPCPRCGKPFLFDRSVLSARARQCAHCKMPAPARR
jgi:hypothetical protein